MKILKALVFLTFFCACKNTNSTETPKNSEVEVDTSVIEQTSASDPMVLYAKVDKLRLREKADKKAKVLEQIKEGEKMLFLKEETDFKDRIKLRGQWYEEPWLKVESARGNVGWVFGGAVTDEAPKEDFSKMPYDKCEADFVQQKNQKARRDCYGVVAAEQLAKDARYIKETDTGYRITLLSGETVNLVDEVGPDVEEKLRLYEYRYYLDKIGYFVFRIDRFEGGDYILLDDKFGYAMPIYGMPRISPDLKKIVICNANVDEALEYNGIQLLEITEEGINPVPIFEERIKKFQAYNPVWVDNESIEFDFLSPATAKDKLKVKAKLALDVSGDWNLRIQNQRE